MPHATTWAAIADLAEDQWGLFTRIQVERTGMAASTLARLNRDGVVDRVAAGVYRLRGVPVDDRLPLRAAWLQLAPGTPAWERTAEQGVVSHHSAAFLLGLGHLPADTHHFTVGVRKQTRRADVHLHRASIAPGDHLRHDGLPVLRPALVVAQLLRSMEDPGAVAQVVADALRQGREDADTIARAAAPHAGRFGIDRGDGETTLRWLLDLASHGETGG